jgi:hypothetical protein
MPLVDKTFFIGDHKNEIHSIPNVVRSQSIFLLAFSQVHTPGSSVAQVADVATSRKLGGPPHLGLQAN